MYNRYIPQPDGSYRRSRQPDAAPSPPERPRQESRQEPFSPPPKAEPQEPLCRPDPPCGNPRRPNRPAPPRQTRSSPPPEHKEFFGVGNFLRQLLPKDFDTEDLLVVILLLLMSGDGGEDQNFALLTLGLYLFM